MSTGEPELAWPSCGNSWSVWAGRWERNPNTIKAAGFGWISVWPTRKSDPARHYFSLAPRRHPHILDPVPDISSKLGLVLAAEDEESDAVLLQLAFGRAGLPNLLVIVRDGQEAIEYLSRWVPYADGDSDPLPSLLLLDLKMPRMTGFDVLAWLRDKPQFKDLPVVVLSSSSHESDIQRARELGAWDYHIKPHGLHQFVQLIKQLTADSFRPAMAGKNV
jgi:CheY-like chemotaxis protein